MVSWADIQQGIFAGESGGDYGALYNYQNRPNGLFSNVNLTNMTIGDVIQFTSPQGQYAQYVKGQVGRTATPVGAYQVVGSTLRDAVNALGLDPSQKFDKATQDKIGQWIFKTQGTGAWQGYKGPQSQPKETDMSMNPNAPQRTGLLGFMDLMREPDPSTGMTAMERFGAALDPLLAPNQRMGEQFRASGAQRLQTQSRNRTIETLKQRAAAGDLIARDVLSGLESGAYDAKTAMSLYLGKRFETPTQTETFTNMTGKQLNEKFGTELDPTKMYNVSSSGKITQVGGGDTIIGGSEKAWEKGIGELGVKTLEKIQNDAASAVDMLGQTQILTSLMNDPAFQSGALQEPKMAYQKIVEALGGDPANVGTQEAFQAVTAQLILDKMGGSLGAGFSEGDRKFVERMAPSLSTSRTGNQLIIKMNNAIANRKIQINEFANQYIAENGMLDQNFNAALSKWAKENPIFVDINPTDYFN